MSCIQTLGDHSLAEYAAERARDARTGEDHRRPFQSGERTENLIWDGLLNKALREKIRALTLDNRCSVCDSTVLIAVWRCTLPLQIRCDCKPHAMNTFPLGLAGSRVATVGI